MQSYIVNGGEKVEGEIKSSGSKNSSLPILAATILNKGTTVLKNVPDIHDTKIMSVSYTHLTLPTTPYV